MPTSDPALREAVLPHGSWDSFQHPSCSPCQETDEMDWDYVPGLDSILSSQPFEPSPSQPMVVDPVSPAQRQSHSFLKWTQRKWLSIRPTLKSKIDTSPKNSIVEQHQGSSVGYEQVKRSQPGEHSVLLQSGSAPVVSDCPEHMDLTWLLTTKPVDTKSAWQSKLMLL